MLQDLNWMKIQAIHSYVQEEEGKKKQNNKKKERREEGRRRKEGRRKKSVGMALVVHNQKILYCPQQVGIHDQHGLPVSHT